MATCTGDVANGATIDTSGFGTFSFDVNTTDEAGNNRTVTASDEIVETVPPTAAVSSPVGALLSYRLGRQAKADWSCDDLGGSGLATCTATDDGHPIAKGDLLNTATLGDHTLVLTATDGSGNVTTTTVTPHVRLRFSGWDGTLAMLPRVNAASAGAAVSFRVRVGNDAGQAVSGASVITVTSTPQRCNDSRPLVDVIDPPIPGAGPGTVLSGVFVTDPSRAGLCRALHVTLSDGTVHSLLFKFR